MAKKYRIKDKLVYNEWANFGKISDWINNL